MDSIIDDATKRNILVSSADIASRMFKTLVRSIRMTPNNAATVIFKIPVAADKTVTANITLDLKIYCLAGKYMADHSIGKISFLPLRFLISFSSPLINKIFPDSIFCNRGNVLRNFLSLFMPIILQFVSASKFVCDIFLPIKNDLGATDASIKTPLSEEKPVLSIELKILSSDFNFSVSWSLVSSKTILSCFKISTSSKEVIIFHPHEL